MILGGLTTGSYEVGGNIYFPNHWEDAQKKDWKKRHPQVNRDFSQNDVIIGIFKSLFNTYFVFYKHAKIITCYFYIE